MPCEAACAKATIGKRAGNNIGGSDGQQETTGAAADWMLLSAVNQLWRFEAAKIL